MDTLLAYNDAAALVGDHDGGVRTTLRSAGSSSEEWEKECRSYFGKAEHWYPDKEGAPFTHHTGGYSYDDKGEMTVEVLQGVKPYETFSDESVGLSVRAAFLPYVHVWVIADREH